MRSVQSRVISQVVVLALTLSGALAPAMARTSGAVGANGGAASPGASAPGGGSGGPTIDVFVQRVPPVVRLKQQATRDAAGCVYDSTGELAWAQKGQFCPNVQE
jgi:hypothetical protein